VDLDAGSLAEVLDAPPDDPIVTVAGPPLSARHRDDVALGLRIHDAALAKRPQDSHELGRDRLRNDLAALLAEAHGALVEVDVAPAEV